MAKRLTGKVKCFDKIMGQGLITPDDGSEDLVVLYIDIYAHLGEYQSLGKGEEVEFVVGSVDGRTNAINVTGPNKAPISSRFNFGGFSESHGSAEGGRSRGCFKCQTITSPIELCLQCEFYCSTGDDGSHGGGGSGGGGWGSGSGSGGEQN